MFILAMFFILLPINKFKEARLTLIFALYFETQLFLFPDFSIFLPLQWQTIFYLFFFLWSLHHSKDCTGMKAKQKLLGTGVVQESGACKEQGFKSCHIS